jgi:hypothetical protein
MRISRRFVVAAILSIFASATVGCHREKKRPVPGERAATVPPPEGVPPAAPISRWNPGLGPALVLAGDSGSATVDILRPGDIGGMYTDSLPFDLRSFSGISLDLFGRSGHVGTAMLHAGVFKKDPNETCTIWPMGSVTPIARGWEVALAFGHATAIPLDSLPNVSSADSAGFVAEITRVASLVPETNDPVFSRVPFVVRRAYKFQMPDADGFIALLQRTIPSEATARVEHVFLIAERARGTLSPYRTVFTQRVAGTEAETVETDVLALVELTATHRPVLVVNNAYFEGAKVELVERVGSGMWRETWRSAYSGC